jgi:dTDP-4-amino-4,6-dideoxygalactose transaminase
MSAATAVIPFHRPYRSQRAQVHLNECLSSGQWSGNGPFGRRCRDYLAKLCASAGVFLTPSCTSALEMAACLLDLQAGDEVIVPSFTFVSSASSFALLGARPVFVDVDPKTLNLDPQRVAEAITPRTRALVAVHYAGIACDLQELNQFGLPIIEDNAHGLFGSYQDRPLGGQGLMGTLSFHETKNVSCGEGGALLINHPEWLQRAEVAQEKGTNRASFLLGLRDKYTWVAPGSSYLLSDVCAALLWANLQDWESVQRSRLKLWTRYQEELSAWAEARNVRQPHVPQACQHPAHLYYLLMPDLEQRQSLMNHLRAHGVQAAYHYQALHLSPMGQRYAAQPSSCPVSENAANCLIRLPLYADLSLAEQTRILELVTTWRP